MNNSRSWLLGVFSILVWSGVAAFIRRVSEDTDPIQITYISIFFGCFFSILYAIVLDKEKIKPFGKLFLADTKLQLFGILSGIFLVLHYFSIYYIFSTDYVIKGNIINYLWPVLLYLLLKIYNKKKQYSAPSDFIFLIMSFLGVALTLSPKQEMGMLFFFSSNLYFILSILSAISAALYFFFSTRIRNKLESDALFFTIPLLTGLIISSLPFWIQNSIYEINLNSVLAGFFLGFFSLSSANIAWIYATSINKNPSFPSIAYFIPVLSTILVIVINGDTVDHLIISGLALVFVANIFIHIRQHSISEIKISISLLIIFLSISILTTPGEDSINSSLTEIAATIFALFAAFLLNRVWKKNEHENLILSEVINLAQKQINSNKYANSIILSFEKGILDMYICGSKSLKEKYLQLRNIIEYYIEDELERHELLSKIRVWYFQKNPVVSNPELLMLFLLGGISIIQLLASRTPSLLGDFTFTIYSATITFIIYIIYEYDRFGVVKKDNIESISGDLSFLDPSKEIYIPRKLERHFEYLIKFNQTFFWNEKGDKIFRINKRKIITSSKILSVTLFMCLIIVLFGLILEKKSISLLSF
ncbi:MAG: DMT family transporter [Balneola sp.]|nr:MAG: DMT family transporter [Balneola sp.]